MTEAVDYLASAELYAVGTSRLLGASRYMRFASVAEALRYAVEQVPVEQLRALTIEAGEARYDGKAIRALYDAPAYPLQRPLP
ncbi:hypothetical protein [Devosia sp. A16]|uniref:hypothetical protein n=1 Tax=Devosia sp. A16 TaxID=1736675 RepID=UPI0006D85971|nr:hypothetical protein [Devosia sp. A16]